MCAINWCTALSLAAGAKVLYCRNIHPRIHFHFSPKQTQSTKLKWMILLLPNWMPVTGHLNQECNIIRLLKIKNFFLQKELKRRHQKGQRHSSFAIKKKIKVQRLNPAFTTISPKKDGEKKGGENGSHWRANENPQIWGNKVVISIACYFCLDCLNANPNTFLLLLLPPWFAPVIGSEQAHTHTAEKRAQTEHTLTGCCWSRSHALRLFKFDHWHKRKGEGTIMIAQLMKGIIIKKVHLI